MIAAMDGPAAGTAQARAAIQTRAVAAFLGLIALLLTACHLLALEEGPAWSSPLLIGDHLFDFALALLFVWYCYVIGRVAFRALSPTGGEGLEDQLAHIGLGIGSVSLGLLALGLAHLFYAPVFFAIVVGLTVVLRSELAASFRAGNTLVHTWVEQRLPTAPTAGLRLALLTTLIALAPVIIRGALPVVETAAGTDWDALAYHLAAPKIYVTQHALVPRPDLALANAPAGGDILFVIGEFAGSEAFGKTLSLAFMLLLSIGTFALGKRLFGSKPAWLASLLFLNTLWLGFFAPSTIPDMESAFLLLCGVSDLLAWSRWGAVVRPWRLLHFGPAERLLLRSGLLLGCSVSFKLTALPILPACGLILVATLLVQRGDTALAQVSRLLKAGIVYSTGALLPALPWWLKSLYYFGSPFYPAQVSVASEPTGAASPVASTAQQSALDHLWWLVSQAATVTWYDFTPLCVLLPLAPFVLRQPQQRLALMLYGVAIIIWLVYVPLYLPPRYMLGLIPLCSVLVAGTLATLASRTSGGLLPRGATIALLGSCLAWLALVPLQSVSTGWLAVVVLGWIGGALVLAVLSKQERPPLIEQSAPVLIAFVAFFGFFLNTARIERYHAFAYATGQISRTAYLMAQSPEFPAENWVNEHTPPDAHIALINLSTGYYLDRSYSNDWYMEVLGQLDQTSVSRLAALKGWCRMGVRFVVFNHGGGMFGDQTPKRPLSAYVWIGEQGLDARSVFSQNDIDVLAIHPCDATTPQPNGPVK